MFSSLSSLKIFSFKYPALIKITVIQLLFIGLFSLLLAYNFGALVGFNFMQGALVAFVPSLLFARVYFRKKINRGAKGILNALYFAEFLKILLTAALFAAVFQAKGVLAAWVFAGYIATQLVYCVSSLKVSFRADL